MDVRRAWQENIQVERLWESVKNERVYLTYLWLVEQGLQVKYTLPGRVQLIQAIFHHQTEKDLRSRMLECCRQLDGRQKKAELPFNIDRNLFQQSEPPLSSFVDSDCYCSAHEGRSKLRFS
jgi:hypothetical protein